LEVDIVRTMLTHTHMCMHPVEIQFEEKKVQKTIREAAKRGDMGTARVRLIHTSIRLSSCGSPAWIAYQLCIPLFPANLCHTHRTAIGTHYVLRPTT
jgi:hypothetical protein